MNGWSKKATPKTNIDLTNFVLFPNGKHNKQLELGKKNYGLFLTWEKQVIWAFQS